MKRVYVLLGLAILASALRADSVVDAGNFTATITDLRNSAQGNNRFVTATIRFQNKTTSPIILGYVWDSALATDDKGNRYKVANDQEVRGIGIIHDRNLDAKFVIQPGGGSDGRFEFWWTPSSRNDIFGSQIGDMELTVRELNPEGGSQYSVGAEHLLHYDNPSKSTVTAAPVPATAPGRGAALVAAAVPSAPAATPAAAGASAPPAAVDQCAGKTRCYDAGTFVAEVTSLTGSQASPNATHVIKINVRFRNTSPGQNVVLGYKGLSGAGTDNLGNAYVCCGTSTDTSVTGMPIVGGGPVNPSFALKPGQSANATFTIARFAPRTPLGSSFTFDAVVLELEVLNATQIRDGREYALHFPDLTINNGLPGSTTDLNNAVQQLKGIFGGRKK